MIEPAAIRLGGNAIYALPLAEGGVLLVDAGPDFDGSWQDAVAQARGHGFAPTDVRTVLVTHAHIDHAGLAHRWASAGARILAAAADLPALAAAGPRGDEATREARRRELRHHGCPEPLLERFDSRPGRLSRGRARARMRWETPPSGALDAVEDGASLVLEGGDELRVISAPGHTPGNLVAFVVPSTGANGDLYTGDTLLPGTFPTPGLHFPASPGRARWPSLSPFLESTRRLRALPARRVLPGHGEAVDDPERLFDRFEAHHARRARRFRALLAERPDSAYGLVVRLFPHLPEARVGQGMTEAIGHLDLLLAAGEATYSEQGGGGVLRFRLTDTARP